MRYSNTTHSFYPEDLDYPNLPSDLIEISAEDYHAAMNADHSVKTFDVVDGRFAVVDLVLPLEVIKLQKKAVIRQAVDAAFAVDFSCSALGAPHLYGIGKQDQANLNGNVVSSMLPGLPSDWTTGHLCGDAAGVWLYRAHTAAQIQRLGAEVKAKVLGILEYAKLLELSVDGASSDVDVAAIHWDSSQI